jgi:hypothetical protein
MDKPGGSREIADYSRRYWVTCMVLEFVRLGFWVIWLIYGSRR